jgi:hypothetical protein
VLDRFFAGVGHEEDGVVDSEGDEKDEGEQGQGGVDRGEVEDQVEDHDARSQCGGGRERGREQEQDRGDECAQERDLDEQHDAERERWDHEVVAVGRFAQVEGLRGLAADECSRLGGVDHVAELRHCGDRVLGERVGGEHHAQLRSGAGCRAAAVPG